MCIVYVLLYTIHVFLSDLATVFENIFFCTFMRPSHQCYFYIFSIKKLLALHFPHLFLLHIEYILHKENTYIVLPVVVCIAHRHIWILALSHRQSTSPYCVRSIDLSNILKQCASDVNDSEIFRLFPIVLNCLGVNATFVNANWSYHRDTSLEMAMMLLKINGRMSIMFDTYLFMHRENKMMQTSQMLIYTI